MLKTCCVCMHAGSCWAFSMVGSVEGINAIKRGKLRTLSEQEVLDCSGDGSCKGGHTYESFDHAIKHGLALDQHGNPPYYPAYVAQKKKCRFNPVRAHTHTHMYIYIVQTVLSRKIYKSHFLI